MIRRLGGPAWQRLHRLVYVAAAAGAVHFVMLVKAWSPEPLIYAALGGLLLIYLAVAYFYSSKSMAPARRQRSLRRRALH